MSEPSVAPAAAVDHLNPRTDLAPVIIVVAASTASNVSSIAFAACCSEVGAGGETGSGEDGTGGCVMDTSDSGAGGSASGITHIRDTGNSGYSGGVSGASVVPAAAVDHFNPGTDLAPVITVVKASTDMSSVAFAASAGANDNGSGWDDFEKPLDMLLEEELEMWKENENDSMDEGAQEDEQFEIEIDNGKTVGSENSSASEDSEEEDACWKCGSDPNRVEWVSGTLVQGQQATDEVRKMRNRQGIQKSKLVQTESDMKTDEFEALALLRRRVKEMRANGEMDAQHDAGAATQLQERIEEESRDFKSSFCEFRNKRVKCRNVEDLSGKQNEGRDWVKIHLIPWAEASFRWRRQKRWDQMTATRADTHCQRVWVTINGLIAKTKQAAIAALMSSGIQAEERRWNEAEFPIHRRQSGRIEQKKFIVRAIPNATLKELLVQIDSDLGCEVTCDVRTIKEYQLENCGIFEPPPFRLSRIVRDEWTAWHKLWRNLGARENQIQCLILLDVEARIHEEAEEIQVWSPSYPRSLQTV